MEDDRREQLESNREAMEHQKMASQMSLAEQKAGQEQVCGMQHALRG